MRARRRDRPGPRLMPCMRGEAAAIASTLLTPSAVSRMAWIRIGLLDAVPRFELRQQLVEIVDVPGALDLGQHDDVELVADRGDDLGDVVERPGRVERVDARPQAGRRRSRSPCAIAMKPARAASLASAGMASSRLPSTTSTWRDQLGHLGAHLLDVRRHEMDHALEPHRQFAQRRGRADGERLKELARQFHGLILPKRRSAV